MIVKGIHFSIRQLIALVIYYSILYWLPDRYGGGGVFLRRLCCKHIFKHCGKNVNIKRKALFGSGRDIVLGNFSDLGENCCIPSDTIIGNYVMMAPNCYILDRNHNFDDLTTPMILQGDAKHKQTIIEDDVWIGRDVLMTPGRHIRKGSIIAAGTVLCKNFEEYAIVGGNPSKLIRYRNK